MITEKSRKQKMFQKICILIKKFFHTIIDIFHFISGKYQS